MKLLHVAYMVSGLLCAYTSLEAQTYFRVTSDSARVVNGELIIGNQTQDIRGVLINKGNGVTEFQKLQLINIGDSAISIAGQDTLQWNGNSLAGEYYILSQNIPVIPRTFYHPLAFEAPLDSGKLYRVHVLIYLGTKHAYDSTSILQSRFSDTIINDQVNIYNVGLDTTGDETRYFLEYNKLIQSKISKDTFKLYFKTNIADGSGNMTLDSLSYLYVEEVKPKVFSPYYTVDTPAVGALKSDEYYILDSAAFNFTPVAQNIPDYIDVVGDPARNLIAATAPNGWNINTVSTSAWNGDPNYGDSSCLQTGMAYLTPNDPYGYERFDSSVITTSFENTNSQYNNTDYNIEISGLDTSSIYQIFIIGSVGKSSVYAGDLYATRTSYTIDNVTHTLNAYLRTSKAVVFDTLKPDENGKIRLYVAGIDTTHGNGSVGTISALKIYEISKMQSSNSLTSIYRKYYDTTYINDGTVDRMCIYFEPYDYNPSSTYPLLVLLCGQGEVVAGVQWDPEILAGTDIGQVAQHEKGKIYGLKTDGDTSSFFILIPQTRIDEWSLTSTQLNNIITNFKSRFSSNINDSLFLAGLSSGGSSVEKYLYKYAYKITGAFIQSPAPGGSESMPTSQTLRDTSAMFPMYGTHVWLSERGDQFSDEEDSIKKYIELVDPSLLYHRIIGINHSGFAYEYLMKRDNDPKYEQNIYDFFVNPTQNDHKVAYFCFRITNSSQIPGYYTNLVSGWSWPYQVVYTGTDPITGWTLSTVSTSKWAGAGTGGGPNHIMPDQMYQYYTNQYVAFGSGIENTKTGGFAGNGPNLMLSGLIPNTSYEVWIAGYSGDGKVSVYSTAIDEVIVHNGLTIDKSQPVKITGTSDASGNLGIGVYPSATEGTGTACLDYIIVKEMQ